MIRTSVIIDSIKNIILLHEKDTLSTETYVNYIWWSYISTPAECKGIHVGGPRSITGETDITSIYSPVKKVSEGNPSSSLSVCHRTPHTSSKAEHILAQVSAAESG